MWTGRISCLAECGGQQWVSEVVFPCGTRSKPDGADLRYMTELLELIENTDLPTLSHRAAMDPTVQKHYESSPLVRS